MRILVAEDDVTSRKLLSDVLGLWGHETIMANDGLEAWEALHEKEPEILILDWIMPKMDGLELIKKVRVQEEADGLYILLLTGRDRTKDIVRGLEAGADDYMCKPFDMAELKARLKAGQRVLALQAALARRIRDLESAMAQIKRLEGVLPICMYCHKIRTDKKSWERLENYISEHAGVRFSHGLCPECKVRCQKDDSRSTEDGAPGLQNPIA